MSHGRVQDMLQSQEYTEKIQQQILKQHCRTKRECLVAIVDVLAGNSNQRELALLPKFNSIIAVL